MTTSAKQKVWYKEKTPVSLNNLLLETPFFQLHPKLIPPAIYDLNTISQYNEKDCGASEIPRTYWYDRYGSHYSIVLKTLQDVGLMIRGESYQPAHYSYSGQGHCKTHKITNKAIDLLSDTNREYLYKLKTDQKLKDKIQKKLLRQGYNIQRYGDARDDIKHTLDNIEYDFQDVDKIIKTYPKRKRAAEYFLLICLENRDNCDLLYNDSDNRIWNIYTQLTPEIKKVVKICGLKYQMTIDIRSCYPSMWAEFLYNHVQNNPNLSPHIVYGNVDIKNEKTLYNSIFLSKVSDPRDYLSQLLNIPRLELKHLMIAFYNGKGFRGNKFVGVKNNPYYAIYNCWLKTTFPILYSIWLLTDIRQTGNKIGKYFETKVMLHPSVFAKAKELRIEAGYVYDGYNLYSNDCDRHKCVEFLEYLEALSQKLLGITLVFVNKDQITNSLGLPNTEKVSEIDALEMLKEESILKLSRKLSENKAEMKSIRGYCWKSKNWKPYRIKEKQTGILVEELEELVYDF